MRSSIKRSNGISDLTNQETQDRKEKVRKILHALGFPLVGFLNIRDTQFGNWITPWLENKFHAEMKWMENHATIRANPGKIEAYAQSIIVFGLPYFTLPPKAWEQQNPISNYAWGEDYHVIIKKKIKSALASFRCEFPDFEGRGFVDTAPLPEKIIGFQAGLGWIGKNSLLVNEHFGSYFFLGEIVTNQHFESDHPKKERCGNCDLCVKLCPNQAIMEDKMINSNRCASWISIEKRGEFDEKQKKMLQYQIFGCDICQKACPWNQKLVPQSPSPFSCAPKWLELELTDFAQLTEAQFQELKQKSPLKRSGIAGLRRNAETILINRTNS